MNLFKKLKTRQKLITAFKESGIYKLVGSEERKIYPKIHATPNDKYNYYVFTLPTGVDPKMLKKNFYVFQQIFGDHITLDGDFKRFTLTIRDNRQLHAIPYDYPSILETIQKENILMPIVCGDDGTGKIRVYDATNSPNLLIYGEPGSGKSSILHVIICTLIQRFSPNDIHFYMADFKQSELNLYEDVEHVKNVSYQVKAFAPVLSLLKRELDVRGTLLRQHRVRHINKVPKPQKPPYIVLVVDEFVMIKDDDVMSDLLQIASLGRAYGIYLVLSMQRPSHKILSTDVRGLLSVRMGFRTVDKRNAMIGETPGSEMISKDAPGTFLLKLDDLIELRAPYLNEETVEKLLEGYKSSNVKKPPTPPLNAPTNNQESKNTIFEVLDE